MKVMATGAFDLLHPGSPLMKLILVMMEICLKL